MAITDLLDRIPFPAQPRGAPATRPFRVELPPVERVGVPLADAPGGTAAEASAPRSAAPPPPPAAPLPDAPPPLRPPGVPASPVRPPLPSYAVVVVGGLTLLSLALAVALAMAARTAAPAAAAPPVAAPAAASAAPSVPEPSFGAEPAPIPVDLLTRLEEASEEPLGVELNRLLDAVQHGFGSESAQLEPTLRSYVYRMSSRFEWNPDTFKVAVTAPDADLAEARGALLGHLFENATATGRLQVGTGTGPHALTLVTE